MYTLGIDCHKKYSQVAVLDEQGKFIMNSRLVNTKEHFNNFLDNIGEPCHAVIEAGYIWGVMYDLLKDLGVETTVAHPLKVKAIASAKIKTDSIDARTLAELLHANLIPEVYVPSTDIRHQKDILRQRCWFVKLKTMLKNRIHQVVNRNHIETSGFTDIFGVGGRKFLNLLELSYPDRDILRQDLACFDFISEQIRHTEGWIDESLKENKYRKIIKSIPGFGKMLSALVALEIADINRFNYPGKLSAYAGLVPSTYASGGKISHGNLLSCCNRWLRYAFVEASWIAIVNSPYFRGLYTRIKVKKGSKTAIVVVARRLSEVVYHCLKENRSYEERPYKCCIKKAA
jgi:transposase